MKTSCELINDLLPLYVDDVISEEGKTMVEDHCVSCEKCSKVAKKMKESLVIPMDNDTTNIKNIKKKYKMSIWLRVVIIVVILLVIWFAISYLVVTRWTETFPKANVEDIKNCTEIVIIGEKYYLHTNDIFGCGVPVCVSGTLDDPEFHFYLGENGIHNLGLGRSYRMDERLYPIGTVGVTKKIVYEKPDGSGQITLFEEGDFINKLDGTLKDFEQ